MICICFQLAVSIAFCCIIFFSSNCFTCRLTGFLSLRWSGFCQPYFSSNSFFASPVPVCVELFWFKTAFFQFSDRVSLYLNDFSFRFSFRGAWQVYQLIIRFSGFSVISPLFSNSHFINLLIVVSYRLFITLSFQRWCIRNEVVCMSASMLNSRILAIFT